MPLRELRFPHQIDHWLREWGLLLTVPGEMILIGSGALLWHAWKRGMDLPLPENSMDVDPVTESEEIAMLGYDAMIGSDFEKKHGWHVNLMPWAVLQEFPADWRTRAETSSYGLLTVIVPSVEDLLIPKLKRGEPRDKKHIEWSKALQK
jgi:hypothetical protein